LEKAGSLESSSEGESFEAIRNLIVQQGIKSLSPRFNHQQIEDGSPSLLYVLWQLLKILEVVAYASELDSKIALLRVSDKETAFNSVALQSSIGSIQTTQSIHAPKNVGLSLTLPSLLPLICHECGCSRESEHDRGPRRLSLLLKVKGEGVQIYGCVSGRSAIHDLPIEFREIILLREFEELSYKEISGVLGCPAGTVMSRLGRARAKLRTALANTWSTPGRSEKRNQS
jgi:hypothetical protein